MIGLDTNILVRYLLQDDIKQSEQVDVLLREHDKEDFFINNIVICELITIMEKGYKYDRSTIAKLLARIFSTKGFYFENITSLWLSLERFEKESVDFVDVLVSYINVDAGCDKTLTFYQAA